MALQTQKNEYTLSTTRIKCFVCTAQQTAPSFLLSSSLSFHPCHIEKETRLSLFVSLSLSLLSLYSHSISNIEITNATLLNGSTKQNIRLIVFLFLCVRVCECVKYIVCSSQEVKKCCCFFPLELIVYSYKKFPTVWACSFTYIS